MTDPGGPLGNAPRRDHAEGEHEVTSLRRLFAERRLSIASMDRSLRVATAAAAASVAATVLLLALRDLPAATVYLGRASGAVTQIGQPLFVAVLVLVSLGFGYLFAAVSLASLRIAVPAVALMTFGIGAYTGAFGGIVGGLDVFGIVPAWARWTDRALLVLLVAGCLGFRALDRARGREPRARIALVVAFSTLVGGYLAVFRVAMPTVGGLDLYGATIDSILSSLVFVMWPILQVAAVDFGEWGQLSGERLTHAVTARRRHLLWASGVLAAALMACYGYWRLASGSGALSRTTLLAAVRGVSLLGIAVAALAGGFWGLRLQRRRWSAGISFGALVGACAIVGVVLPDVAAAVTGRLHDAGPADVATERGTYAAGADVVTQLGSSGPTRYSFQIPRGWVTHDDGKLIRASSYDGNGGYERLAVAVLPVVDLRLAEQAFGIAPSEPESFAGWQGVRFTRKDDVEGFLWVRSVANPNSSGTYVVYEAVHGRTFSLDQATPLFEAVLTSFRGDATAPAPLPPPEPEQETPATVVAHQRTLEVGLGLAAAALVVGLGVAVRRRWHPQWISAGLVVGAVSVFSLLYDGGDIGHYLFGPSVHVPHLSEYGVLFGTGVLGLAVVGVTRGLGRHGTPTGRLVIAGVIGLEAATAALQLMTWLYDKALSASRISVWAAVILLVAVVWDVTMSGESMTNHGTAHLPRASRVLGFFGYTILLAGTILFYTSERTVSTGRATEPFFEPESITRNAMFRVALPVLLLSFLIRLARAAGGAAATWEAPSPCLPDGAVSALPEAGAEAALPERAR